MTDELWDAQTFLARLQEVGARAYHDKHPFHLAMNEGRLSRAQLRCWLANRFYYQRSIPRKDAAIISNCPLREVRRLWIHRIRDHDGDDGNEGGIEAWLRLGQAAGLTCEELLQGQHLLPGVQSAVDAYVKFARDKPWPIAIASSLTELFAPDLMASRLSAFEKFYPWIDSAGLDYFRRRITQARRDSDEALAITMDHCDTAELQREAVRALEFKCDLLWSILDSIDQACRAFLPQSSASEGVADGPVAPAHDAGVLEVEARPTLAPGVRLQVDTHTGKSVLLFPEGVVELNETAHEILRRCDGRSLGEIIGALRDEYEIDLATLRADACKTLAELQQRKLVQVG